VSWLATTALVGLGGALGANARYWLGRWVKDLTGPTDFPWGTLLINVSGSLVLGLIAGAVKDRSAAMFLFWGTGFCGGYTTFSAFSLEVAEAVQAGRWGLAAMYVGASVVGGLLGFAVAVWAAGPAE